MSFTIQTVKKELELTKPTFEQMNLNKVSFAQEMEFAMQAFTKNPALLNCRPDTVKNCLVNIALSGLTLSPVLKFAHLVPRKGECCLDPSYMGLIKIITDTGSATSIKAKIVFSNEPFDIELGTNGYVKHTICKTGNKGKRIGAYSIAVLNDGSNHVEWMYEEELMAIKKRAQAHKGGGAVWNTDEDEMCRKTVVKRHWKYLPKTERAQMAAQAIGLDNDANGIDFEKEQHPADINETLDTTYEEIVSDDIPPEAVEAIKTADIAFLKAIWANNKPLQEFPEFQKLIEKRRAELDLEKMQAQHQQPTESETQPPIQ